MISRVRRNVDWHRAGFWIALIAACLCAGALWSILTPDGIILVGAVYGACCGGAVMLFEQGVIFARLRAFLRQLPWLAGVLATEAVFLALIMAGAFVAGLAMSIAGILDGPVTDNLAMGLPTTLYALLVSGLLITLLRMRDLIGAEAFRNILLGRYHRPVEEGRIFLFIDLVGSTAYAQAQGDLRAQAFLGAIFSALAEPVRRHGGAIEDYVGDMALVTWSLKAGIEDGRCVTCVFAFLDEIMARSATWTSEFGQVPRFRAALHGGTVVTAEIGVDRHKITYFGDVVNTTGRIETLCRTLDEPLLISSELLDRLPALPAGVGARSLGPHALKGRGQMLTVLSLERTSRDGPGRDRQN